VIIATSAAADAHRVGEDRRCFELVGPQRGLDLDRARIDTTLTATSSQRGRDLRT